MSISFRLRNLSHPLVQYRFILSLGLSAACGIVLHSLYPVHDSDPLLRLLELERPTVFHGLLWSYNLFLYSTPFLFFSILFSLAYVRIAAAVPRPDAACGLVFGHWRTPPSVEAAAISRSELALHL